jgi:hypothetical protein
VIVYKNGTTYVITDAQEAALRVLCTRYHVTFEPSDYTPQFDLPAGYVGGWVGGWKDHGSSSTSQRTIYVGVDRDGRVSS